MKQIAKYIIIIILFIILVVSITFSYLSIHYMEKGTVDIIKKYYDIVFDNVIIDNDSNVTIKVDSDKDLIHVRVPDLNSKNKKVSFSLDVKNIGNVDAFVDGFSVSNVDSNIDPNNIKLDMSLLKDDIIKGGEYKKLIVNINYNGKDNNKVYYNFNINYNFDEVKL